MLNQFENTTKTKSHSMRQATALVVVALLATVMSVAAPSSAGAAEGDEANTHNVGFGAGIERESARIIRRRGHSSSIAITGIEGAKVLDVNVGVKVNADSGAATLDFSHGDKTIKLVADRTGTSMGDGPACRGDYLTFDDDSNLDRFESETPIVAVVRPDEPLGVFNGDDAVGAWTLRVNNPSLGVVQFDCFKLRVTFLVPGSGVYTVTSNGGELNHDDDELTLRDAMALADVDGKPSTINLPENGEIALSCETGMRRTEGKSLTINGNGSSVGACADEFAFHNESGPGQLFTIEGLAIIGGRTAIANHGVFRGHNLLLANGRRALDNTGIATLTNSAITGNEGGVAVIRTTSGRLSIRNSAITSNAARAATLLVGSGTIDLRETVVALNSATVGGLRLNGGSATMVNVTFDRNKTRIDGGVGAIAVDPTASATLRHVTVTGNASPAMTGGTLTLLASVIAQTDGGVNCLNTGKWRATLSADDDDTCNLGAGNLGVIDPMLEIVEDGLVVPRSGSPLIDAVPECPAVDQRGVPRPQGRGCDVGAIEVESDPVEPGPVEPGPVEPGPVGQGPVDPAVTCAGRPATIVGTSGNDVIRGTAGVDVIAGLGGNDVIHSLGGNDIICGGQGNDRILAGSGRDRVYGQGGSDRLIGGAGRDRLDGGIGHDVLIGGSGRDRVLGKGGRDTLHGGNGRDRCNGGPGIDRAATCERIKNLP